MSGVMHVESSYAALRSNGGDSAKNCSPRSRTMKRRTPKTSFSGPQRRSTSSCWKLESFSSQPPGSLLYCGVPESIIAFFHVSCCCDTCLEKPPNVPFIVASIIVTSFHVSVVNHLTPAGAGFVLGVASAGPTMKHDHSSSEMLPA